jgi:hypothetical protein
MRDEVEPRLPFDTRESDWEWTDDGQPLDPHDTLADPERDTRLRLWDDEVADDRREDE